MINSTQYASHSFTFAGARTHMHTHTHTQPTTSLSRNAATYLPNFTLPKPPVGGNNSALTQPFPCEHKRPYHRDSQSPHLFCKGNVLSCSEKQFRVTWRNGKGMKESEIWHACNLQK